VKSLSLPKISMAGYLLSAVINHQVHQVVNNNITEILKYVPWAREGGC
jgi:hypothetical protein